MNTMKNKTKMVINPGRRAFLKSSLSLLTTLTLPGCGGGSGSDSTSTVSSSVVAPSIIYHPADQAILSGERATFSVVAEGTQPLSYQWYRNGVAITGATTATYTTPVSANGDDATFSVTVSNSAGTARSNDARLTVSTPLAPPSIVSQPEDRSVTAGETASFQVVADGSPPLVYQWQRNGVDIPGATGSIYTTPVLAVGDDAVFSVTVSNTAGTVSSRDVLLVVSAASITVDSTTITVDSTELTVDRL